MENEPAPQQPAAKQKSQRVLRRCLVFAIYFGSFCWGFCQSSSPEDSLRPLQLSLAIPFLATWWLGSDAQERGKPVLHVLYPVIFVLWIPAIPVYLIATRGFWGLLWFFIHMIGLYAVTMLGIDSAFGVLLAAKG